MYIAKDSRCHTRALLIARRSTVSRNLEGPGTEVGLGKCPSGVKSRLTGREPDLDGGEDVDSTLRGKFEMIARGRASYHARVLPALPHARPRREWAHIRLVMCGKQLWGSSRLDNGTFTGVSAGAVD
ncbi:hypothetical protein CIB48_g10128 [Xylaria polymorpha]|nr:hypothetical protein CIB48_g10128 [Xylaria polymorpha]